MTLCQACESLQGCCAVLRRGDSSLCELFTGSIVDASDVEAIEVEQKNCRQSGGDWRSIWSWIDRGEWVEAGELRDTGLTFQAKEYLPINRWVDDLEVDKSELRRIIYSAFGRLTSDVWVDYLRCRLDPTVKAVMLVAEVCSPQASQLEPIIRDHLAR
ncbi:hypothetical protein Pmar_PMAR026131 [Perkinsus marinus ATCC 50983]|uniref:Uncharacterized protein n=1 Tax=Perkinsus marinus (strain ATCC 50983 / TXsc) TaxID=423536 RepID=C5LXC7_PERM5|nr:hypothetical protein Pmar_PMAR026131 [Perkinsus marinus ATCC 50983]EEQ98615.1 hypothetical protein Pmar_PMAR026131 [Perkinsus marinus ATCC 50983]|eukprot:XP_002765898.1 hypothetical protein Pmar_PMAR026131 [Perkinsus marinus ATCC 50983]